MVSALVREMEPAGREARSTQRCAVPRRRLGCALAPPQGPGPEDASPSPACSALLPTPCRALWGRGCLLSRLPGCQALLAGAGGALLCAQSPPGAEQRGGAWGASAPSTATADQAEPGPEWVGEPHRVRVVSLGRAPQCPAATVSLPPFRPLPSSLFPETGASSPLHFSETGASTLCLPRGLEAALLAVCPWESSPGCTQGCCLPPSPIPLF